MNAVKTQTKLLTWEDYLRSVKQVNTMNKTDKAKHETLESYDVRDGIIRSPGKFEGEPMYAPYFYDALLNGFADEDEDGVATFIITDEDRKLFPMLADTKSVRLWESDQGFIHTY